MTIEPDPREVNATDIFGPPIHVYSRAQAIADGELVDVSETAREAGLAYPTALTRAVWAKCVRVPPKVECQDEAGRLWDVLWMTRYAIRLAPRKAGDTIYVHLLVRNDNRSRSKPNTVLKCVCGPGDDPSPCLTIMLPEED